MTEIVSHITVAVALPVSGTFTYGIPAEFSGEVEIGSRVLVPFGNRRVTGYVLDTDVAAPSGFEAKPIEDVLDSAPLFPADMIPLFLWISDYYLHAPGEVIRAALPGGINRSDQAWIDLASPLPEPEAPSLFRDILPLLSGGPVPQKKIIETLGISQAALGRLIAQKWLTRVTRLSSARTRVKMQKFVFPGPETPPDLTPKQAEVVACLGQHGAMAVSELNTHVQRGSSALPALIKKNGVRVEEKPVYRDPLGNPVMPDNPPCLLPEQNTAVERITGAMGKGFRAFLLDGVTGSGKTEVYLRVTAAAIESGKTALILVPEIALITQTERRFRARFGERIAVLHSGLSDGQRLDQWLRIAKGEAKIVIGARSAIFAPVTSPGIIIVDEEHDASYKQENGLKYNARDLAAVRAKFSDGVVVLGSATPSLQSAWNAETGKFERIRLSMRVNRNPLPAITLVDLKSPGQIQPGAPDLIGMKLHMAIESTLARKEQVLIFLNRRGYATYPVCGACGASLKCPNCDITQTLHQDIRAYKCHFCGHTRSALARCDACGSTRIQQLGIGTEKVETSLRARYPHARIARLDQDTTAAKGVLIKTLKMLRNREIDILVGTQMIAKGHDFPNITLVGILCADMSLNIPDFRASERTFQLLAQVAGRAGRGDLPGRIIMQAFNPSHFSITAAQAQDAEKFYRQEISFRKALGYPPISRMAQIRIWGKTEGETRNHAEQIGEKARILKASDPYFSEFIDILGPVAAAVARLANRYRFHLMFKSGRVDVLLRFLKTLTGGLPAGLSVPGIQVSVDVDPYTMT